MKNKKPVLICLSLISIGVISIFILNSKSEHSTTSIKLSPAVKNEAKSPSIIDSSVKNSNLKSTPQISLGGFDPSQTTILRLAGERPDLNISAEQAQKLQLIYNNLCIRRALHEVEIAKITQESKNKNHIEIPAYKDFATSLIKSLSDSISEICINNTIIASTIIPLFEGDNYGNGDTPRILTITAIKNELYDYELQRISPIIDKSTGIQIGVGRGNDQLKDNMLGIYEYQRAFFPSKLN